MLGDEWTLIPAVDADAALAGQSDVVAAVDVPLDILAGALGASPSEFGDELGISRVVGLRLGEDEVVLLRMRVDSPVSLTQLVASADLAGAAVIERLLIELDLLDAIAWRNDEIAGWPPRRRLS